MRIFLDYAPGFNALNLAEFDPNCAKHDASRCFTPKKVPSLAYILIDHQIASHIIIVIVNLIRTVKHET